MEVKSQLYSMLASADIDLFIVDDVLSRLQSFGYSPCESDVFTIGFSILKTITSTKNSCALIFIPPELHFSIVDCSCAEILLALKISNKLLSSISLDDNVKSISIGDTSISFDNSSTSSFLNSFDALIDKLFSRGECDVLCFRRLHW